VPDTSAGHATRVKWRDWDAAAFDDARAQNRPVLLSIVAKWSRGCDEMDAAVFDDAALASVIADRVVPIRVDADRRPDINDRYNLGGWPTTAILSPEGDVLGGGTFVPADRLRAALLQAADAVQSGACLARRSGTTSREGGPKRVLSEGLSNASNVVAFCREQILTHADRQYGGFGGAPKFHHADALAFALECYRRERDEELLAFALRTLDAMAVSDLWDAHEGGFFRHAIADDWSPQREKTLESNVRIARVFLDAWNVTGDDLHRDRLLAVIQYIRHRLSDPGGGFHACETDSTLFADLNGLAADLFARVAIALSDESLLDAAARALDRVLQPGYTPGDGIAHYVLGDRAFVRGLLCDHVYASGAALTIFEAADRPVYSDLAAELMHFAVRTMWDEATGGFRDRTTASSGPDIGLLREPFRPFAVNCDAAIVLSRLGRHEIAELGERAEPTLASLAGEWREQGLDACKYVLALLPVGQP